MTSVSRVAPSRRTSTLHQATVQMDLLLAQNISLQAKHIDVCNYVATPEEEKIVVGNLGVEETLSMVLIGGLLGNKNVDLLIGLQDKSVAQLKYSQTSSWLPFSGVCNDVSDKIYSLCSKSNS
ncbi:uncharacterized protein LOC116111272 isoform X2 [Pistacia vera]|uniref:uncharacterized protein LOC116111272 isoform X2 n=1 Tax=Pistacia vera TaxID=55513 RepID=UPI001263A2A5|nr:uncharacterized protein LOC116111272 isoform X2 [Pistacia vera]